MPGEVTPSKYVDQRRPALLAEEIVDDLLILLSQRPIASNEMEGQIWDTNYRNYNLA